MGGELIFTEYLLSACNFIQEHFESDNINSILCIIKLSLMLQRIVSSTGHVITFVPFRGMIFLVVLRIK